MSEASTMFQGRQPLFLASAKHGQKSGAMHFTEKGTIR